MAQETVVKPPAFLLRGAADRDSRARENRRFSQGVIVGLDKLARTARVSVTYYDGNGAAQYIEAVPYPAQLNPSIGDVISLDYPHSNPQSVRITTTGLGGSNSTGSVSTVPHNLLDGLMDQDTTSTNPAKGMLIVGNNTSPSKWTGQAVGTDGMVLVADSTQANGVRWGSAGPVSVDHNGTLVGTQPSINFIDAGPFATTVTNNSGSSRVDITIGLANEAANLVLAGPSSGAAAVPTFRALVVGDLPASGTNGQVLRQVSGAAAYSNDDKPITVTIDGGGSAIVAGWTSAPIYIPYGLILQSVTIGADQSGSIQFDIWVAAYPTIPTSGNSIVASDPPKLSSQQSSQDTALTGWSTSIAAGSFMIVKVTSANTVQKVEMVLKGAHS